MYVEHESFQSPDNDDILWRYMDFTKFVSLIESGSLYFSRADKFEDRYEGVYPKHSVEHFSDLCASRFSQSGIEKSESEMMLKLFLEKISSQRSTVAVNCWHKNMHESAAMWKLYLSSSEGVAVKTRFSRLKMAFSKAEPEINIGLVNYIDYDKDHIGFRNTFDPFLYKRMSFEHEKEVRAIVWRRDLVNMGKDDVERLFSHGMAVPCDLRVLIEDIYVSPTSQPWFRNLVASIAEKFDINVPVHQSKLNEVP